MASVAVAVLSVVAAIVLWVVFSTMGQVAALLPSASDSPRPVSELLLGTRSAVEAAASTVRDASALGVEVGDGSRRTADALVEAGDLIETDVADSLQAVDEAMPALIEAGRVIDGTLRTLALLGVRYDPPVPFDDALADVQAGLEGLPAGVRRQGSDIAALAAQVDDVASDSQRVADSLSRMADELDGVSATLSQMEATADGVDRVGLTVGTITGYRPIVAILLIVALVSGLTLSAVLWRLGQSGDVGLGSSRSWPTDGSGSGSTASVDGGVRGSRPPS